MPFLFKKITTAFALLSFMTMAFFGFASMSYGSDGRMQGDCPFSVAGASLCPPSALPGAIHHLSAYQSFLNVPVDPVLTALIIALLTVIPGIIVLSFLPLLYKPPAFVSYSPTPVTSHSRKIKRWLSLFENSPSH